MMESGFEASFSVAFFDGDSTMDMGNVLVDPSLDFKSFRSVISQKIGVSPHQITIYFERGPLPFGKVGGGRRVPVTNKFNFASILRERNCFFFVVSKRSRRVRRRKNKQSVGAEMNSLRGFELLRRNADLPLGLGLGLGGSNYPPNWFGVGGVDYVDHSNQLMRALEVEKEWYLMSLNLNSNVYSDLDVLNNWSYWVSGSEITSEDGASSYGSTTERAALVCEVCSSAKREGQTAPFHWCKCDAVLTTVFRSPAGPIARPARKPVVDPTPSGD